MTPSSEPSHRDGSDEKSQHTFLCRTNKNIIPNYHQILPLMYSSVYGTLLFCTGYIVFSGIRRSSGVQGLRVIVQSDRTPEYVEGRVEAFLHSMAVSF